MRAQHALDHFTHHGETKRIGAPARAFGRGLKLRLSEQNLGIVTGARPRILIDPLLRDEGGVAIDEFGQRRHVADWRRPTEKFEQSHTSSITQGRRGAHSQRPTCCSAENCWLCSGLVCHLTTKVEYGLKLYVVNFRATGTGP